MNTFLNSGIDATHLALEKKLKLCPYAGRQLCINMIHPTERNEKQCTIFTNTEEDISHIYESGFLFHFLFWLYHSSLVISLYNNVDCHFLMLTVTDMCYLISFFHLPLIEHRRVIGWKPVTPSIPFAGKPPRFYDCQTLLLFSVSMLFCFRSMYLFYVSYHIWNDQLFATFTSESLIVSCRSGVSAVLFAPCKIINVSRAR